MSRSFKLPTDLTLQAESDLGKIQVNKERFDAFASKLSQAMATLTERIQQRWPVPEQHHHRPCSPLPAQE